MLNHVPELKNQLKKCVRCGQCHYRHGEPVGHEGGARHTIERGELCGTAQIHLVS